MHTRTETDKKMPESGTMFSKSTRKPSYWFKLWCNTKADAPLRLKKRSKCSKLSIESLAVGIEVANPNAVEYPRNVSPR